MNSLRYSQTSDYEMTTGFKTFVRRLPDTGQSTCYNDTTSITCGSDVNFDGQDANYSKNAQSFTDNSNSTITDDNTRLMWQKENDNTQRTWEDAKIYCANSSLGGYSDWRLPSLKELQSVVNKDIHTPSINQNYFPNTYSSYYWSSITYVSSTPHAWYVHFGLGNGNGRKKTLSSYVRCVRRGSESVLWAFDFSDNGNTISHGSTELMWQKEDDDIEKDWGSALSYCEDLNLGGYSDWRLPDVNELQTIIEYGKYQPAIDSNYFPGTNSSYYWSSTTHTRLRSQASFIDFGYGYLQEFHKTSSFLVRCTRFE